MSCATWTSQAHCPALGPAGISGKTARAYAEAAHLRRRTPAAGTIVAPQELPGAVARVTLARMPSLVSFVNGGNGCAPSDLELAELREAAALLSQAEPHHPLVVAAARCGQDAADPESGLLHQWSFARALCQAAHVPQCGRCGQYGMARAHACLAPATLADAAARMGTRPRIVAAARYFARQQESAVIDATSSPPDPPRQPFAPEPDELATLDAIAAALRAADQHEALPAAIVQAAAAYQRERLGPADVLRRNNPEHIPPRAMRTVIAQFAASLLAYTVPDSAQARVADRTLA